MGSVRWKRLMAALRDGDLECAAHEALDSDWFRDDSPDRALNVAFWIANRQIRFIRGPNTPPPEPHATFRVAT